MRSLLLQTAMAACLLAHVLAAASLLAASEQTRRRVKFNEGIIAFTQAEYAAAEQIFTDLVVEESDDAGALYWLGLCQLQLDRHTEAAESFERVLRLAPDRAEVKLDAAIALVGQERFADATGLLRAFVDSAAGDATTQALAQFFLGVAEYKVGDYAAALTALEAAAAGTSDPTTLANIAWYRSWVYFEQHDLNAAAAEFDRAAELSGNPDQQLRAQTLAGQIRSGAATPVAAAPISQFAFRLDCGFNYDTNVILLGDDTSIPINLSTDEDFRFGLSTDTRFTQPLGERWLLGVGGSTFHSWHASLQEYNVQTYGGRLFLNYFASERTTLGLQYEYDFSLVDNSAFLSRHRVTPSLRFVEAVHEDGPPLTSSTVFYSFEDRNYQDDIVDVRTDRDGTYQTAGVSQDFNISQPRLQQGDPRWLYASTGYRLETDRTEGDDYDMTGQSLLAGLNVPLRAAWVMELSALWSWEDYWKPNTQDFKRRPRDDFVQRYIGSLGREFQIDRNITMGLRGEIAWTDDDSNVRNRLGEAVYSYDRVIYSLTLSFTFD